MLTRVALNYYADASIPSNNIEGSHEFVWDKVMTKLKMGQYC